MGRKMVILVALMAGLVLVGVGFFWFFHRAPQEFSLTPPQVPIVESPGFTRTEVGTGWGVGTPAQAAELAVTMALDGKKEKSPDFAILFANSGCDLAAILSETRKLLGERTKIYGGTSDYRGLMTNKGYIKTSEESASASPVNGLTIMTVSSPEIKFGVGSASFPGFPSVQEATKAALLQAMASAGKSRAEKPRIILITPTSGAEDNVLRGIEELLGQNVVVLGGTSGGPKFEVCGEREVYEKGLSLAVIYTDLPIGWVFEGGFEVTGLPSGVITKLQDRDIIEIDHRPALEVYDEWLDGKIAKFVNETDNYNKVNDLLVLHPFYRKFTSKSGETFRLFSHPWPQDKTLKGQVIMTSSNLKEGERIYLSQGTWETLLNRVGNLPVQARSQAGDRPGARPIISLGYICAGVMGIIPEGEREKMAYLINYANHNAPFIVPFTWGEQGHLPGIANKHGNLLTSFMVIMEKD